MLDEPTIGLHPRDNAVLLDALGALAAAHNTLVVVEHDEDTIRRADHVIDLGQPPILEFNLENRWIKGPVPEYNVVAEIPGGSKRDEIVMMGAHLDSWDVGQGAHDDGAGCVTMTCSISCSTIPGPWRSAAK